MHCGNPCCLCQEGYVFSANYGYVLGVFVWFFRDRINREFVHGSVRYLIHGFVSAKGRASSIMDLLVAFFGTAAKCSVFMSCALDMLCRVFWMADSSWGCEEAV